MKFFSASAKFGLKRGCEGRCDGGVVGMRRVTASRIHSIVLMMAPLLASRCLCCCLSACIRHPRVCVRACVRARCVLVYLGFASVFVCK